MWRPQYDDYPLHRDQVSWYRDGKPSVWSEPSTLWPKFRAVTGLLLEACPPPACVLDVGCFTGYFLRQLAVVGYSGMGVDLQADLMRGLHETVRGQGPLDFYFAAAENVGDLFPAGRFDAITCLDVMEHVLDEERVLTGLDRVLRSGGTLVFHVPREDDGPEHLRSYRDADAARHLGARWGGGALHDCQDEHGRPTWLVVGKKA